MQECRLVVYFSLASESVPKPRSRTDSSVNVTIFFWFSMGIQVVLLDRRCRGVAHGFEAHPNLEE
jgi:hypothetical protein